MAWPLTSRRFFKRHALRLSFLQVLFLGCAVVSVCLLVAGGVLAGASGRMAKGDNVYRSGSTHSAPWAELRRVPWKAAVKLEGAEEQLRFREINAALNELQYLSPEARITLLQEAVFTGQDMSDEAQSSMLLNKVGVLALVTGEFDKSSVEQALVLFREAIIRDEGNEDAKWNLELLETLIALGSAPSDATEPGNEPGESSPGYQPPGGGY